MPFGISAGISAGGSLLSGLFGKHSASDAAKLQAQTANKVAGMATGAATNAQNLAGAAAPQAITDVNAGVTGANQLLAPYSGVGSEATSLLGTALAPGGDLTKQFSFNPTDLQNDPGYQFRLQQGNQAIQNSASARGTLVSGGTLKDLMSYGQNMAGTEYQNAYNRALNTFQTNRNDTLQSLLGTAQLGMPATMTAAGNTSNAGYYAGNTLTNTAQYQGNVGLQGAQIAGNALTGGANAQAAGIVGGTNALNSGIAGAGNALTNYSIYNRLFGGGGASANLQPGWTGSAPPAPDFNPLTFT